ncbi:hypothetical protein FKW77_001618 [Venturia effusa]|uniref:PDZ GRASP-type domain-containing protein n=1 Tax=Venturia effusa TaxID=50376 RepID=A0A517L6P4_9PEZI|nr:hypothetical protein FKW77_001618 [Venturia effusa]
MFGALNRFMSRLDGDAPDQRSKTGSACGFQVLRNNNTELPLEPWFDFIIGINGRTLDNPDPNLFATEIRNCAGSTISLGIWTAKGQRIREVYVNVPKETPTLGLALQWTPLSSTDDVWHIMDVTPNSPADLAGLLPYGDYVIGSPQALIRGDSGLAELIEDHLERPLRLLVYNHEYNLTRPVDITPTRSWGGQGAMGCTLGFGALHRIPAPLDEPPAAPGETMFSTADAYDEKRASSTSPAPGFQSASPAPPPMGSSGFLVPANIASLADTSRSPPPAGSASHVSSVAAKKKRVHHQFPPAAGSDLDALLAEGEAKSKEDDYAPKKGSGTGLPPPPKVGGPPRGPSPGVAPTA